LRCLLIIWWGFFFIILPFLLHFFLISANFTNCFLNSCYSVFFLINYIYFIGLFWLYFDFFYVLFLAESPKLSIFSHDICFDFWLNHEQNKKNFIFLKKILITRNLVNHLQCVMLKLWLSNSNVPQFTKNLRWLVRIILYYFMLYFKVYWT